MTSTLVPKNAPMLYPHVKIEQGRNTNQAPTMRMRISSRGKGAGAQQSVQEK